MSIVYKATNKINGDFYIGRTSMLLRERLYGHYHESLSGRRQDKFHLAINKFGFENFDFAILHECNSVLESMIKETESIVKLNPTYNTKIGASGKVGSKKKRIEETKISNLNNEAWKSVVGFEGYYEVSNMGRVRGIERVMRLSRYGGVKKHGKLLKPCPDDRGRLHVYLSVGNKKYTRMIHSLVAAAFVGAKPDGHGVCHRDGNKQNNVDSNLYYGTQKQNMDDRERHGRTARGSSNPRSKLNPELVGKIIDMRKDGVILRKIGQCVGVSHQSVMAVLDGISWSHVTGIRRS